MSKDLNKPNNIIWNRVILIAGAFGLIISVLVIANYLQLNRYDPVNIEIIDSLIERLNETPNDEQLREQIREIDLLARKAYFTSQWQIRTGGYLLLIALALIVVAYQMLDLNRRKQVSPNTQTLDIFGMQKRAQQGVLFVGAGVFILAGILILLTNNQLENRFSNRLAESNNDQVQEVAEMVQEEPIIAVTEPIVEEAVIQNDVVEKIAEEPAEPNVKASEKVMESTVYESSTKEESPVVKPIIIESKVSKTTFKQNFSSFRGYGGLGIAYQKNIPTDWDGVSGKNILWKKEIPVQGYNSPIIWGDKLFLSGANESTKEVYCYNRLTGDLIWKKSVSDIEGSPATTPETTDDTGLAASTMATDGKNVFVIFGTGDIAALNMEGKMLWGRNLGVPNNHYGHSSSLYVYKDKLIVQYDQKGDSKVLALNTATGKTIWSMPRQVKVSWASPIIINQDTKPELILAADPFVASYNLDSGKENWKVDCIYGEVGPSAAYTDGIVFALNEYATLAAIKIGANPEVIWEGDMYLSDVPSPVAANGLLIVATSYGAVVCHDAKTGDILWEQEFGNNIYASPIVVGELVYLLDMKGIMHIFKMSKDFEKVGAPALGESSVCTPAFADGHIYIRAGKSLYAIGK